MLAFCRPPPAKLLTIMRSWLNIWLAVISQDDGLPEPPSSFCEAQRHNPLLLLGLGLFLISLLPSTARLSKAAPFCCDCADKPCQQLRSRGVCDQGMTPGLKAAPLLAQPPLPCSGSQAAPKGLSRGGGQ